MDNRVDFFDNVKKKVLEIWNGLDLFGKTSLILSALVFILSLSAVFSKNVFAIIFSIIQIVGLVGSWLIHKEKLKVSKKWLKYLILGLVFVFTIINISSYSWNVFGGTYSKKINVPYRAEECIGKNIKDVANDFRTSGFLYIDEQISEDLEYSEIDKLNSIESVSVDGITDFDENAKFKFTSKVVLVYHSFKRIPIPFSSDEIANDDADTIVKKLKESGFVNVTKEVINDLDPDKANGKSENRVVIDGGLKFEKNAKYPIDTNIKVEIHKPYEKYKLKVVIEFISNLLFNKYDVVFSVGENKETIKHGTDAKFEYTLKEGDYTLLFVSEKSEEIKTSKTIQLTGDTEVKYKITCGTETIEVEELYLENKGAIGDGEAMVPSSSKECESKNYKDIEKKFKEAGFTNISTKILYDIVYGITEEGEVEKVSIDGESNFERGDIFKKDAKIVISYHMKQDDDPSRIKVSNDSGHYKKMNYLEVEQVFKELGFKNIDLKEITTNKLTIKDGEVCDVVISEDSFDVGETFKPSEKVLISYYIYKVGSPVSYSTNDDEMVKLGNKGVYSYKKSGSYDIYWIIDFDEGYIYYFTDGNGESFCDKVKINPGDLNKGISATWNDGNDQWTWSFHFKYVNSPTTLVIVTHNGMEIEYSTTNLSNALRIRDTKTIKEY